MNKGDTTESGPTASFSANASDEDVMSLPSIQHQRPASLWHTVALLPSRAPISKPVLVSSCNDTHFVISMRH